jgi:hypothetical protein
LVDLHASFTASPSPADIRHDNQVVALGLTLSPSHHFRLFGNGAVTMAFALTTFDESINNLHRRRNRLDKLLQ